MAVMFYGINSPEPAGLILVSIMGYERANFKGYLLRKLPRSSECHGHDACRQEQYDISPLGGAVACYLINSLIVYRST